jgi:hypothetical protein
VSAEAEIERLRDVVFRYGRVLVAKGAATPADVIADWSGDDGADGIYPVMPEERRLELGHLHRPFVRLLKTADRPEPRKWQYPVGRPASPTPPI